MDFLFRVFKKDILEERYIYFYEKENWDIFMNKMNINIYQ